MSFAAAWFNVAFCLGGPILILVGYAIWRRPRLLPFAVGILTFLVSQFLTRIPLLGWLQGQLWFVAFSYSNPALSSAVMGFSAGVFEEVGRWVFILLLLRKSRTWQDAVAFGLGHGGLEAGWIGVMNLQAIFTQPVSIAAAQPYDILLSSFERLFAVILHVGLTILVMRGLVYAKARPVWLLVAILIHGLVDTSIGILLNMWGMSVYLFEGLFAIVTLALLAWGFALKKSWPQWPARKELTQHEPDPQIAQTP